jgi:hypothetical protein
MLATRLDSGWIPAGGVMELGGTQPDRTGQQSPADIRHRLAGSQPRRRTNGIAKRDLHAVLFEGARLFSKIRFSKIRF